MFAKECETAFDIDLVAHFHHYLLGVSVYERGIALSLAVSVAAPSLVIDIEGIAQPLIEIRPARVFWRHDYWHVHLHSGAKGISSLSDVDGAGRPPFAASGFRGEIARTAMVSFSVGGSVL